MDQPRHASAAVPPAPRVTTHARARMQQRGIRADVLEALLDFGSARFLRDRGRELVFFDKRAKRRLARANLETERLVRAYAIVASDGAVITVGHRYRRVRKP